MPGNRIGSHSNCPIHSTQVKSISSVKGFFWKSKHRRKSSIPLDFSKISSLALKQICNEAERLQSFPLLSLAAALVPPFTKLSSNVLAVPLETSSIEAQRCIDQRPCEVESRGCGPCGELYFQNLDLSRNAVEHRTGIEFPTMLDNSISGESNSSFPPEVLVGTGSRTMTIIRIKSLKVYAFGFYVHPFDVCEKLGPKYASIPESELNKRQDFYQDLLRKDINMTLRLVVSCNGIKIKTVKDAFEKALRARLARTNPDADFRCLQTFGSMFPEDIPLNVGTTINIHRTADGHLITEIGGSQYGAVQSKDLCRAFFDMYIGDVPVCEQTKEEIGKNVANFDYQDALTKSIIFLEAQRSGKLPKNHRPSWRGDSALQDGKLANVDLVGGYYDAGDNVKYGLPMAFTVTTLSWAAIFYRSELQAAGEIENVRAAIRWGTDYFLKASSRRNHLYVEVGDPVKDHECWVGPENMKTPRTVLKIDQNTPGTEIAAETSAALTSASIAFRDADHTYSRRLLNRAKSLFSFAKTYKGTYDGECPFYCSYSGFNDELLWAATWLYTATRRSLYLDYILEEAVSSPVSEFSWDLKYAGAQILLTKLYFEGQKDLHTYNQQADSFVCSVLPDSPHHQVYISPGGLVHLRDGANSQYVTGTAFLFSVYSDILATHKQKVTCGNKKFDSVRLLDFAKQQMDYLLGKNPKGRSYMVGFGKNPPRQAHHRGASVPKIALAKVISCPMSFVYWYNKNVPNPNELTGAIVGGPDKQDNFEDLRTSSAMTEPTTYTNSLAIGVLAKLAKHHAQS
ncbi:hypothetical protein RD792_005740 [Penstemon davidsonii]|uniref:Endoglucanase n=1 Tax=Penstemon davidsonii TaxID=160366 RepID=A0ABR0DEJ9_9LAMI|nr:hypothetical protein RD792_005740 [Penstemon davidsonii]